MISVLSFFSYPAMADRGSAGGRGGFGRGRGRGGRRGRGRGRGRGKPEDKEVSYVSRNAHSLSVNARLGVFVLCSNSSPEIYRLVEGT